VRSGLATLREVHTMKKIIVFDLDGTLAPGKQSIDAIMGHLLADLLMRCSVAVISGGDWPQFEKHLVNNLPTSSVLTRLFLLPTSGTKLYRYESGWKMIYADSLQAGEREAVLAALENALAKTDFRDQKGSGEVIEDRGSQITFSGLGQQAPADAKAAWDPAARKRSKLKADLDKLLPDFAIRIDGDTSIDIMRLGVDKASAMKRLSKFSGIERHDMPFVGGALYSGGNDASVRDAGYATIAVKNIEQTKLVIETIIKCGGNHRPVDMTALRSRKLQTDLG
jgi:HAD superfamily hydrolase (TIGR01484 family)